MNQLYTPPEVSVVVPTFNEAGNVALLVERLTVALDSIAWEVLFVEDDSTDGTIPVLRQMTLTGPRVRLVHRIGRRALSVTLREAAPATGAQSVCS